MRRLTPLLSCALLACVEPTLTVIDDPPAVVIQRPGDLAVFDEGEQIDFVGKVQDDGALSEVVTTWLDNGVDVLSVSGAPDADGFVTFSTADLDAGTHAISLRAVDGANLSADAAITIEVVAVADEPQLTIVRPTSGEHTLATRTYVFEATVSDAKDAPADLVVEAESDVDGFLCELDVDSVGVATCEAIVSTVGTHRVTFTVTDTDGFSRDKSVVLIADEVPQLPTITPVSPTSGASLRQSEILEFRATVADAQDLPSRLIATLTSDVDGPLCTLVVDTQGSASCFAQLTTMGSQFLTYDVADSDGNHGTANLLVRVADPLDIDDDGDSFTENQGDCDDGNPGVRPGATELPNGLDEDCDGLADEGTALYDDDGDGYCDSPNQSCTDGAQPGDCNDGSVVVNPSILETCSNGVDDNCSGAQDEPGAQGCLTYYLDADGDGYGDPGSVTCGCALPSIGTFRALDCNDAVPGINPTATELANGYDDDCDGLIDEGTVNYDNDGDGYCAASACSAQPGQTAPAGGDCNDTNANIAPNRAEVCGNGLDDNCNSLSNEGVDAVGCTNFFRDDDNDGFGGGVGVCMCAPNATYATPTGNDCYDQNDLAKPGQSGWFTTDRGDGSFDYNCNGGADSKWSDDHDCGCPPATFDPDPFIEGWDGDPGCGNYGTWVTSCTYLTVNLDNPFYPFLGGPFIQECVSDEVGTVTGKQQQCH